MDRQRLISEAKAVLAANDMGEWTRPTSNGLYPHQWLWDSFFISIGLRHYDLERAKAEVRSPFRAQWKNGMLPHIIFGDGKGYHAGPELWHSTVSPSAPKHIQTTGITQPPVAAEAVVRLGELMKPEERLRWYREMYPQLLKYHSWLYRERDPRKDGLVEVWHSWETGMDNAPPLMEMLHKHALSKRVQLIKGLRLENFVQRFRRDTAVVPAEERISTIDLHAVYDLIRSLRRNRYNYKKVLPGHTLRVIDLTFNSILIRANQHLESIAKAVGQTLPANIRHAMRVAPHTLETMWDDEAGEYYNRNALTGELIRVSSINTFMPLYSGVLPKERVRRLLKNLHDPCTFGALYPVPSTPLNSSYFKPNCYWQGPSWVNMDWLLIDGLQRNGQHKEAAWLRDHTIAMIAKGGMNEYYSPLTVQKAGADTFSWTAALLLDMFVQQGIDVSGNKAKSPPAKLSKVKVAVQEKAVSK